MPPVGTAQDMTDADEIKRQVRGLRAAPRNQRPAGPLPDPPRRAGRPPQPSPPAPLPAARKPGRKSDCVRRVEEMKLQREQRRRRAEEAKQQRLVEAKEAEGRGGIEVNGHPPRSGLQAPCAHSQHASRLLLNFMHILVRLQAVDFLRKIKEYKEAHGLQEPIPWTTESGGDVWENLDSSSIRVCVRKRPMLRTEVIRHDFDVISTEDGHQSLVVHEPRTKVDLSKEIASHR